MFYYASKIIWFVTAPSNLFAILVLVGIGLASGTRRRRLGTGIAIIGAVMLLVAGLSPLANWLVRPLEERFPRYVDDGRPIAGVIVLGGAVQARESAARDQLTVNEAAERAIALADLARRYPGARMVFTGGSGAIVRDEPAEAAMLARFSGTLGIPSDRLLIEAASRNTYENAVFTRRMVEPNPGERWLLVTSAWHMPRSVGCFRQAGFEVVPYPVDFRTGGAGDLFVPFDTVSDGLRRLDFASKEWIGLVAYRASGYTDALFPAPR